MAGEAALKPAVTDKPSYDRLTRSDVGVLLKLKRDGLTQAQIAQRLGCSQSTVSKWLSDLTDTTEPAKEFLRGSALRMAENIVKKGRAADHVAALKGLNVLTEQAQSGLVVQIGIKDSDVQVTLSPPSSAGAERKVAESLVISAGADNPSSVNQ